MRLGIVDHFGWAVAVTARSDHRVVDRRRMELIELGRAHGWQIHRYNAKHVEDEAIRVLGECAADALHGPRSTLGPPWSKDHRIALAATIVG
jgi:hypothetical protein